MRRDPRPLLRPRPIPHGHLPRRHPVPNLRAFKTRVGAIPHPPLRGRAHRGGFSALLWRRQNHRQHAHVPARSPPIAHARQRLRPFLRCSHLSCGHLPRRRRQGVLPRRRDELAENHPGGCHHLHQLRVDQSRVERSREDHG